MSKCVVMAVFGYVQDYVHVLDNANLADCVSIALADRILRSIDWAYISKLELVDNLITLLRRQPVEKKSLMVPVFDRAFFRAFRYRSLFSSCVDRAIGPSVLSGLESCPCEPSGPMDGRDAS